MCGAGLPNFDFPTFEAFAIGERRSRGFRAEFFHLFSNSHFASPVNTFGVAALGRISSTVLRPREIRLGLRFKFSWLHRPEACEAFAAPKLLA